MTSQPPPLPHILPRQLHPRPAAGVLVFDGLLERAEVREGECENRAGGIDRFQVARPDPVLAEIPVEVRPDKRHRSADDARRDDQIALAAQGDVRPR